MPENSAFQQASEQELLDLMIRFRTAYAKGDREGLLAATTNDFQWHQHCATNDSEKPTGRILHGVDELLAEIDWRQKNWQQVRYEHLEERSAGDMLVQTFEISGVENGVAFHANACDLYPVVDGRIARKDTYWKFTK